MGQKQHIGCNNAVVSFYNPNKAFTASEALDLRFMGEILSQNNHQPLDPPRLPCNQNMCHNSIVTPLTLYQKATAAVGFNRWHSFHNPNKAFTALGLYLTYGGFSTTATAS